MNVSTNDCRRNYNFPPTSKLLADPPGVHHCPFTVNVNVKVIEYPFPFLST